MGERTYIPPKFPSFVENLPEAEYHGDPATLSVSGAKTLLRSPKLYRYEQLNPKHSKAFDVGTLIHALVLGQPHTITVKDWDGRTTAGKNRAAEVEAQGLTVVSADDWDLAHAAADAVRINHIANKLLSDGRAEVSAYAIDPFTEVPIRGRFDWLRDDGWIIDLKTTKDAEPSEFAKSIANFKYHMQAAWYIDLARANGVDVKGFRFVAVEKTPPYLVSVVELTEEAISFGAELGHKARQMWAECRESDYWPDWGHDLVDDIVTVDLPRWAYKAVA